MNKVSSRWEEEKTSNEYWKSWMFSLRVKKKRLSKKKKLRSASSIFYTKQNTSLSVCSTRKELVVRFSSELHNKNFNFGYYRKENALKEKRKVQKLVVLDCLI